MQFHWNKIHIFSRRLLFCTLRLFFSFSLSLSLSFSLSLRLSRRVVFFIAFHSLTCSSNDCMFVSNKILSIDELGDEMKGRAYAIDSKSKILFKILEVSQQSSKASQLYYNPHTSCMYAIWCIQCLCSCSCRTARINIHVQQAGRRVCEQACRQADKQKQPE